MNLDASDQSVLTAFTKTTLLILGLAFSMSPAQAQKADGNPFIDDAKAGYTFRTSFFHRYSSGDSTGAGSFNNQGAGIGGWLYGNTGEIGNILSFGGTYNFTIPVDSPSDKPFNYILRDPGQDSVSVIGEAYGKLRFGTQAVFAVGRQTINNAWYMDDVVRFYNKLDQSMVGKRDIRGMQWLHYEAATVAGRLVDDTVRYYGGYIWNVRQINDNKFRNPYQAAFQTTVWPDSSKTGDSNGGGYGGIQWKPEKNTMVEASYYSFQNMLDMAYVDSDHVFRLADKNYVRLGAQYMHQSGTGSNLITGGRDFSTHYWGVYGELRMLSWLVPYAMGGKTADGDDIRAPFSIGPSYLVQRIGENSKAGERTWIVGGLFDFAPAGLNGLQFDVNYGRRTNRHTVSAAGSAPATDWDELATDLIYTFAKEGFFKNLRARARYAKVWENGGTLIGEKTQTDIRYDIQLNIPFN